MSAVRSKESLFLNLALAIAVISVVASIILWVTNSWVAALIVLAATLPLLLVLFRLRDHTDLISPVSARKQRRVGVWLLVAGVACTLVAGVALAMGSEFIFRWLGSFGPGLAIGGVVAALLAGARR